MTHNSIDDIIDNLSFISTDSEEDEDDYTGIILTSTNRLLSVTREIKYKFCCICGLDDKQHAKQRHRFILAIKQYSAKMQ